MSTKNEDIITERPDKQFTVAVLSGSTFQGIKKAIGAELDEIGLVHEIYLAPYNQYMQEIINIDSALYCADPQLVILAVDLRNVLGELFFDPYMISEKERKQRMADILDSHKQLIMTLLEETDAQMIVHNFEVPTYSPLGIIEGKQEYGYKRSIEEMNEELRLFAVGRNRLFIFDYNGFLSGIGKRNAFDWKMYYIGDISLNPIYLKLLAHEYAGYVKPMLSKVKKCLVLDCDNTLWGGILGEDGVDGIELGPTSEGKPFVEFQKYLLALNKRGLLLAINSKNNREDVLKLLHEHPYMILREEHFSSIQVNWEDKPSNMITISKELNIGLDSLVFFDDDRTICAIMRSILPQITVVEMPDDPALYSETLLTLNELNLMQITDEDRKRSDMYMVERKRNEATKQHGSLEDFLRSLELTVEISRANDSTVPRISQLTQKTNQFNLTTKRYSEEEIRSFMNSPNYVVKSLRVWDKFGDYGLTGVVITRDDGQERIIEEFLLSCRVLGKNVEFSVLSQLIDDTKKDGIKTLIGLFEKTSKNIPAERFYKEAMFEQVIGDDALQRSVFTIGQTIFPSKRAKFITIIST